MPFEGIGASVRRKEDVRFLSGRGNYTDDINRPGQLHAFIRRSDRPHAQDQPHRHRGGGEGARRGGGVHRRGHGGRQYRRAAVRLADPQQGRLADGGAAASGDRDRQGAPCRRSGRRGGRRDEAGGEGRGRADRHRLPGPAGGGLAARCGRAGSRAGARRCARQHLLRLAYRRQGGGRCRVRRCREGGEARPHQQPADPERDGAARRDRRVRRP